VEPAAHRGTTESIHKKEKIAKKDDPYYRTESELVGKDFDKPFYYPKTRKILPKKAAEERKKLLHDKRRRRRRLRVVAI